jgi:hypothetical protein
MTATPLIGATATVSTNAFRRVFVLLIVLATVAVAFAIGRVTAQASTTHSPSITSTAHVAADRCRGIC